MTISLCYPLLFLLFNFALSQRNPVEQYSESRLQKRLGLEPQDNNELCVKNKHCKSNCCLYTKSLAGTCVQRAPIGQICGFLSEDIESAQTAYYRRCSDCDTSCCCGDSCCPTSYCVTVLELVPKVCTSCNSGCCCYSNPNLVNETEGDRLYDERDLCCEITFCAASTGLINVQGSPCLRCQSGCCCGTKEEPHCCLSSFCKGSSLGRRCQRCVSGCCCGNLCCAYSFCDKNVLSLTRLLTLYSGPNTFKQMSSSIGGPILGDVNPMMGVGLMKNHPPMPFDASLNFFNYFGHPMAQSTQGWRCISCTTGCCCNFGCCSIAYCPATSEFENYVYWGRR